MPNWSTDIPKDPRGLALPIRRTPTRQPLQAIVTTEDLLGCDTHFFGGHTVPCSRPDCDPCSKGVPFRWHAYMAALDLVTHLHFIFEVTAQAADAFKTYRLAHGTLRGCHFQAKRWHERPNGRVIIQTKPANLADCSLPKPPDVRKCMAIVWQIPDPDVAVAGVLKGVPRLHAEPNEDKTA